MPEVRSEIVAGKVTKLELRIIEAAAKADGVRVSEYIRTAALTTACLDGNLLALRYAGKAAFERMGEWLKNMDLEAGRKLAVK